MNTVAEKYGFSFRQLGCTIPQKYWIPFRKHNDSVYDVLCGRFGKNWWHTFAYEVDSMRQVQGEVLAIIETKSFILKKDSVLAKEKRHVYFQFHLTQTKGILVVDAYSYQPKDGEFIRRHIAR